MSDIEIQAALGNLGRVVAFRLRPGTDVLPGLLEECRRAGIANGVILTALGSLSEARFCNPEEQPEKKAGYGYGEPLHMNGPLELVGMSGIVCHDDTGETNLHVHMTITELNGKAHGGHLVEGTRVLLTVDVVIAEIEGLVMGRQFDPDLEVPIFDPRQS